ncbi:hypothetical protein DFH09DRAFT_1077332 [Mycena vulgaris]|nr:hypothetical protein DFH09DRAFT_1077332 [Mycena vulgaris]
MGVLIRVTELTKHFCAFECVDREIFQGSYSWIAACKHCPGSRELVLLEEITELSVPATNPRNGSYFLTPTALARPHLIYPPNREFPQTVTKGPAFPKKAAGRHATPSDGQQRVCGVPPASRRCAAALNPFFSEKKAAGRHIPPVVKSHLLQPPPGPGGAAKRRRHRFHYGSPPRERRYTVVFSSSTKAAPHLQPSPAFPRRHKEALIPISRYIAVRERPEHGGERGAAIYRRISIFTCVILIFSKCTSFSAGTGRRQAHPTFSWSGTCLHASITPRRREAAPTWITLCIADPRAASNCGLFFHQHKPPEGTHCMPASSHDYEPAAPQRSPIGLPHRTEVPACLGHTISPYLRASNSRNAIVTPSPLPSESHPPRGSAAINTAELKLHVWASRDRPPHAITALAAAVAPQGDEGIRALPDI